MVEMPHGPAHIHVSPYTIRLAVQHVVVRWPHYLPSFFLIYSHI